MLALIPFWDKRSLFNVSALDFVDNFFDESALSLRNGRKALAPEFDISETDEHIVVKADLPGIDVKDLDIEVVDRVLTLKGNKKEEHEEKTERYHRVERRFGSFCRSILLPAEVDAEKVEAAYKDGVLTMTIAKSESAKPKKIEVKAN
jgi:HSP20 family protein